MRRLALTLLAACSASPSVTPDAGGSDGDGDVRDGSVDEPADAMVDAGPDFVPPHLAAIAPSAGSPTWLQSPVRFQFDEAIDPSSLDNLDVTASIGSVAVAAQLHFEAPDTIYVSFDQAARGLGTLDVHVTGVVTDLAGNTTSGPFDVSLSLPAWGTASVDRGPARTAPRMVVTPDGTIFSTWIVGTTGNRRVVTSRLSGTEWVALGTTTGSSDVLAAALSLDEAGTPLIGWIESGTAHVARWTGTWSELASPGTGDTIALVTPPNGAPIAAVFGSTSIAVRQLVGDAWQPLGSDVALASPIIGDPALAAGSAGHAAIGWIDASGLLRTYRYDSSWVAINAISVGTNAHLSLAARGSVVAVAWDQLAGSSAVLAAQVSGSATAWTRLGRPLDVDMAANAVRPAVALDSSFSPIVGWTEQIEGQQRGILARWTGSTWSPLGGFDWLGSTVAVPAPPQLVLHSGDAPVISTAAAGAIRIARFNGPRVAGLGLTSRASRAGCTLSASAPPALLSQTGCFAVPTPKRPVAHAGLVPYDIVVELWSDGAQKRRWIGLPDGQAMTLRANGSWVGPVGTIMVKEFALETTPGNPATRRPIETRFLINDAALGWQGVTYRWNSAGTDATLQPADPAQTFNWPMDDGSTHAHQYPSRNHCVSCHHGGTGPILGLRPEQLQRWFDYNGTISPQLPTLAAIGVGPSSSAQAIVSPHDPSETNERRMRGYMVANCQHCHNPQYLNIKDLRYTTPLASTRLCESLVPGSPAQSRVYQLVTSRPGMPALGTLAVDPLAAELLGGWIAGMTSCP